MSESSMQRAIIRSDDRQFPRWCAAARAAQPLPRIVVVPPTVIAPPEPVIVPSLTRRLRPSVIERVVTSDRVRVRDRGGRPSVTLMSSVAMYGPVKAWLKKTSKVAAFSTTAGVQFPAVFHVPASGASPRRHLAQRQGGTPCKGPSPARRDMGVASHGRRLPHSG